MALHAGSSSGASSSGMVIGNPVTSGTAGSVLFVDASGNLGQNNADFFWNTSTNQLKVTGTLAIWNNVSDTTPALLTAYGALGGGHVNGASINFAGGSDSRTLLTLFGYGDGQLAVASGDLTDHSSAAIVLFNYYLGAGPTYESLVMRWTTDTAVFGTENSGGTTRVLQIQIGSTPVWEYDASGNYICVADNTYNIGASGANRPKNIFWGTQALATQNVSVTAPDYSWAGTTNYGMYLRSSAIIGFVFNGVEKIGMVGGAELFLSSDTALKWYSAANTAGGGAFDVILQRDGAPGVLALVNGTNAQTFRVYGTTTGPRYLNMTHSGTLAQIYTNTTDNLYLGTNATAYWLVAGATGHYFANTDNSNDIGASGANRPRSIYWGTQALGPNGSATTPAVGPAGSTSSGFYWGIESNSGSLAYSVGTVPAVGFKATAGLLQVYTTWGVAWGTSDVTSTADTILTRSAAGTLNLSGASSGPATLNIGAGNGDTSGIVTVNELVTIAAAATTVAATSIPAGAIVLSVACRVTVVIPTATTFTYATTTGGTTLNTAAVSVAANSTDPGTKGGAFYQSAATTVTITPSAQPAANTGRVRLCYTYYLSTPPTS